MRAAGWVLLIAGAVLCATLVWATVGFLLMGVGLLSLLVAEKNRNRIRAPHLDHADAEQPMVAPEPEPAPPARRDPTMDTNPPASAYDRQAWQRLVAGDADVARIVSVLADYGPNYVDELAKEYLAVGDKARLPDIVEGIIGRAGASNASHGNMQPPSEVKPAVREANPLAPRSVEPVRPRTVGAPVAPPIVVEPKRDGGERDKNVSSVDGDLTAILGRLSPDVATPGKKP